MVEGKSILKETRRDRIPDYGPRISRPPPEIPVKSYHEELYRHREEMEEKARNRPLVSPESVEGDASSIPCAKNGGSQRVAISDGWLGDTTMDGNDQKSVLEHMMEIRRSTTNTSSLRWSTAQEPRYQKELAMRKSL